MRPADDYILELLLRASEIGIKPNPSTIAYNIDYDNSYVSERLRELRKEEMVERHERSYWNITEKGEEYLRGELSADDLERDS